MIFWFTGQPGHGKTLHGITRALEYQDQGRLVYVCNVNQFDHEKTGCLPMTPEQFRDWMNFLPDGAVALVDEAYQHNMLPKRPPGSKVPDHVRELAVHRHRGLDFIFISQSPAKQCDEFVHDLIDRHVHVRRRWGTPFVHLREFDYFERNPVKAHPSVLRRVKLPKRAMGCYKSTELDTTERRIPWYMWGLWIGLPAVVIGAIWQVKNVEAAIRGEDAEPITATAPATAHATEHGAPATGEGAGAGVEQSKELRFEDYAKWLTPRIPAQPWTAPAFDQLSVPPQAPRLFCAAFGDGLQADGSQVEASCACLTEQGTLYAVEVNRCRMIARRGQYEPFRDENIGERQRLDDVTQRRRLAEEHAQRQAENAPVPFTSSMTAPQVNTTGAAVGTGFAP